MGWIGLARLAVMTVNSFSLMCTFGCMLLCHVWRLPWHAVVAVSAVTLGIGEGVLLLRFGGVGTVRSEHWRFLHLRGFLGGVFPLAVEAALLLGVPLGHVFALSSVVQAMLVFWGTVLSGDRLRARPWAALAIALAGALLVVLHLLGTCGSGPRDLRSMALGILSSVVAGMLYPLVHMSTRLLAGVDHLVITVFINIQAGLLHGALHAWTAIDPPIAELGPDQVLASKCVGIAVFSAMAAAQLVMTWGIKLGPAFLGTVILAPVTASLMLLMQVVLTDRRVGLVDSTGIVSILTGLMLLSTAGGNQAGRDENSAHPRAMELRQRDDAAMGNTETGELPVSSCAAVSLLAVASVNGATVASERHADTAATALGSTGSFAEFFAAEFSVGARSLDGLFRRRTAAGGG